MPLSVHAVVNGVLLGVMLCCFCPPTLTPAADGMRWPALAAHLAARYRQAVAQQQLGIQLPENAAELVQPCDRRLLSAAHMAGELLR